MVGRVAALVTVLTLAGAPAVLSACVTLCLPPTAGHAGLDGGPGGVVPTAAVPAAAAAAHDHDAMGHADAVAVPPAPATSGQWTAACDECCADGVATTVPAVAPLRQNPQSQALLATLTAHDSAAVIWLPETRPRLTAPPPTPPSPPRTPAVLRI